MQLDTEVLRILEEKKSDPIARRAEEQGSFFREMQRVGVFEQQQYLIPLNGKRSKDGLVMQRADRKRA